MAGVNCLHSGLELGAVIYELRASALQHIFLNLFLMSLSINFLGNILMMLEAGVNEVCALALLCMFSSAEEHHVHSLCLAVGSPFAEGWGKKHYLLEQSPSPFPPQLMLKQRLLEEMKPQRPSR